MYVDIGVAGALSGAERRTVARKVKLITINTCNFTMRQDIRVGGLVEGEKERLPGEDVWRQHD